MAMEAPKTLGVDKKAPASSDNTETSSAPHWSEAFANAPVQMYCYDNPTDQQPYIPSLLSQLRRGLTAQFVKENDSPFSAHSENMTTHNKAIHRSFANFLRNVRSMIPDLPPDRCLQTYDMLLLFGDFLTERMAYRAKIGHNDPVTTAEIKIQHPATNQIMRFDYNFCLSTTPERFKASFAIPFEAQELVHEITRLWQGMASVSDLSSCNLKFSRENRSSPSDETRNPENQAHPQVFGCCDRPMPESCRTEQTMSAQRTGAEEEFKGTRMWKTLSSEAETFSFLELANTAASLLDGLVYPQDSMVQDCLRADYGERFFELDRFYLPLATQLNPRRDNEDVGRWTARGLKFSHIFHHMRCLSGEKACLKEPVSVNGFKLDRVSRSFSTKSDEWVGERRISMAVVARFFASQGSEHKDIVRCNSLLLLSPGSDFEHVEQSSESADHVARMLRFEPVRGDYAPVHSFLVVYASAIDLWSQHWWHFVKAVENLRQDDDIFHHSDLHNLSSETTDADLYFDIIRLLRTAIQWVEGTGNDFDDAWASVIQTSNGQVDEYHSATNRNFERVRDKLTQESKKLTDKLRQMLEDVSYLRSDLRSAAYLREVSSANRVNEHLMFLAVLTTVYLPLNFIATVCGNSISMPFDSRLKMFGLSLGALVLVALTWYFPSLHKRHLEKRSCKSCPKPKGNKSHDHTQPTSIDSKLGGTCKSSLRTWRSLFGGTRHEKTEQKRPESKKGSSCCGQSAPETV